MKFLIIQENGRHEISKHLRECNSLQRAIIAHGEDCDVWGLGHDAYGDKIDFNSYDDILIDCFKPKAKINPIFLLSASNKSSVRHFKTL
jgi:hypothetical protein